jgi:tetratricopeptide (TPR) repeat protein
MGRNGVHILLREGFLTLTSTNRKSQIAIEYAYRFKEKHPQSHVFWVYAANSSRFYQAYQDIARRLRLSRHDDPAVDVRELVLNWLNEEDAQWLMILDNADNPELFFSSNGTEQSPKDSSVLEKPLTDFLPTCLSCHKSLLITTRRGNLGEDLSNGRKCVEVPPFSVQEARFLLQQRSNNLASGGESSESAKLVGILEYIPLAITQAAAFINQNKMSLAKYLAALEKDDENLRDFLSAEIQDARRERGFPNAVFRTWKLSFNQIQDQKPYAAEMLSLMAFFERREIPESLLKHPEDKDIDFLSAIGTLQTFSLILQETDGETFSMHRLVQLSIHDWLEQAGVKVKYEEQAFQRLEDRFPVPCHENNKICQRLYSHAEAVLRYNLRSESYKRARASLLYRVGWYAWQQSNLNIAEMKILEALTLYKEIVGKGSATSANCKSILGSILTRQGKYNEAEDMHIHMLRLRETVYGKNHPDTLTSMHDIANALKRRGRYEEAMEMFRETLKLQEEVQGKDHPATLITKRSLASMLNDRGEFNPGQFKEAEKILIDVSKVSETILGKEHPETLTTMHELAWVLVCQQKYKEAEELLLQVLESRETVLGRKHPDTLTTMHNLAYVWRGQQKYKEAEEMYLQVLELRKTVLGKKHPETLTTMLELAWVLVCQQKFKESQEILLQVRGLEETVQEKKHPDTLYTVWHLAALYGTLQRYGEAEPSYQRASTGLQETLGSDHSSTVRCVQQHESFLKEWDVKGRSASKNTTQGECQGHNEGRSHRLPRNPSLDKTSRTKTFSSLKTNILPRFLRVRTGKANNQQVGPHGPG